MQQNETVHAWFSVMACLQADMVQGSEMIKDCKNAQNRKYMNSSF
jgi:hypothetical protein